MHFNRPAPLRVAWLGLAVLLLWSTTGLAAVEDQQQSVDKDYGAAEARKVVEAPKRWITADHSKHKILQKDFESGPEVTEACLTCHNEAALQFHETIHWTWICPADPNKEMGKNGVSMNNF